MATGKQAIKRRIRSVEATKKITQAMELIATSKLKRQKEKMEQNREYAHVMKNMVSKILSTSYVDEVIWMKKREDTRPLTIIFTSDLGLCAGYNSNMLRFFKLKVDPKHPVLLIGLKGYSWLRNRNFNLLSELMKSDDLSFQEIASVVNRALEMYELQEVTSINVLFTHFVNSVTFEPEMIKLLPVDEDFSTTEEAHVETIFEPSGSVILNYLIPMYVRSVTYSCWLETKTSEQASRRMAMENATDNAEEIIDKLVLQYNQSRQAAITQEISEIVAGADAL
ncbi:MAG: ATP synthase F1 subunit gamma [Erysipelotrichaceae bacterium]|nr:ATP synthase F1 subunit gamma [Erysipelotrichaceae bacterium]MDP3305305.1 ATP synthase F1 subunit gamma [Erysipelotrichaceae bacterium]